MSVLVSAIRPGAYRDSIVLMQLQAALAELPGVEDAGAVMATHENLGLLEASDLLPDPAPDAGPADLCVVVRVETKAAGQQALDRIDDLLRRGSSGAEAGFRPHSVASAVDLAPGARFTLVSVPGRYAAGVARQALDSGQHVFLYSDHVAIDEEIELKRAARDAGLLVMGPDCGTALIGGVGMGFANRVRRGRIGIVAASGTGLQAVASAIHELGRGVSQGIGTGGRDLSGPVGAITALQGVNLLRRDPETRVIVLISKPPSRDVADRLLTAAASTGKPVVVAFQGIRGAELDAAAMSAGDEDPPRLHFAADLSQAARLAVALDAGEANDGGRADRGSAAPGRARSADRRPAGGALAPYFRGLFSGGTLALEALLKLRSRLDPLYSNLPAEGATGLEDAGRSRAHTVLDLGADEFTVGRPHPMIDNELRLRRLRQEINDPEVGLIMLDVVLGYGAHPDPASELAPVLAELRRPDVAVVAIVVGTDEDPQEIQTQVEHLESAGAIVHRDVADAVSHALDLMGARPDPNHQGPPSDASTSRMPPATVAAKTAQAPPGRPVALEDLAAPAAVISVGLERFAQALAAQDVEAIQVDWRPPAGGDVRLMEILEKAEEVGVDVSLANATAVERMIASRPVLTGVARAGESIPGMHERLLLHAGPPIEWDRMSGPLRGAVIGALLYEGIASDEAEAAAVAASGAIEFAPCHDHSAVGPMAGVISSSMAVYVIEDLTHNHITYSNLNEGYGKVLRYGAYSPRVLDRLRWMNETMAPALAEGLARSEGIDIRALLSEALHMGDEGHNRNKAGSLLFLKLLAPMVATLELGPAEATKVLAFIGDNALSVLNPVMAACKAMADAAHGVEGSTVVTAMARNGTDFGIRVSGLGDRWFTAPAGTPDGLYFAGFSSPDANPDIGDSTITETAGIGAFAMAAAPAIVSFVSGTPQDAIDATLEMYEITVAEHEHFTIPTLNFRGTPTGIDVRSVVELGVTPRVNTGIAHREAGVGQVGAGLVRPPLEIFEQALRAFAERWGV